jgi:hypothetical protein
MDGADVVQVHARFADPSIPRRLLGFRRVVVAVIGAGDLGGRASFNDDSGDHGQTAASSRICKSDGLQSLRSTLRGQPCMSDPSLMSEDRIRQNLAADGVSQSWALQWTYPE